MDTHIFLALSLTLVITVIVALIARAIRQPLIAAYLLAGILVGPACFGLLPAKQEFFDLLSQLGIIFLLFIIGLSLNLKEVKGVGWRILVGGLLQFFLTSFAGFALLSAIGLATPTALLMAIALSFSSTIIVSKLLTEKRETESVYARFIIGILLLQDFIAVLLLVLLNAYALSNGHGWLSEIGLLIGKGFVLVSLVVIISHLLAPHFIPRLARSHELLFIFTIAWCFGVASLAHLAGFSFEIGAVLAGLSLAASPYQSEIASRIKPLRDFFIVLFFIVLGSQMTFGEFKLALAPSMLIAGFVLLVDPLILYGVMRIMKYTRKNAFFAGITAAQVSEFGFILAFKGKQLGIFGTDILAVIMLVALITILVSSALINYNNRIYKLILPILSLFGKDIYTQNESKPRVFSVWVFGYHRIGWKICEALEKKKISFAVVDFNPDTIEKLNKRGVAAFYGDIADIEFLDSLPLNKAKLIISTIPNVADEKNLISHIRQKSAKIHVIASCYHAEYIKELYKTGADYVMMPHLLGGTWISKILTKSPWHDKTFKRLRQEQDKEY